MANTEGRDVVERLRKVRDAALAGESYWVGGDLMPVRISEFEALLAVVEAAKELNPCPFCSGASHARKRFSHLSDCPLVPFLDGSWPSPVPLYDGSSGESE